MNKSMVALAITAALTMSVQAEQTTATDNGIKADEVILVSGKRPEQTLKEVAGSVAVITQEFIERYQVTEMNQLFKYDPGIKITGSSGGAQNFVVRGMGGDRILMIKDGMRMNEGYGADGANDIVGRGFIDMDTIKQVEVAKGPASSMYGSDALGGIVVFTTKDPQDYLENDELYVGLKSGYSSLNEQTSLSATTAFATGDLGHMLTLTRRDGSEEKNYHDTKNPLDIESTSVLYKAAYHISDKQTLKFSADHYQQDNDSGVADTLAYHFRGLAQFGYQITEESRKNEKKNNSFKLSFHDTLSRDLSDQFNVALYQNQTRQQDVEFVNLDINAPMFGVVGIRDMWANYDYEQKTLGLISNAVKEIDWQGNNHTIGYGLDIEQTNSIRDVHEYRVQNGEVILDATNDKYPENDVLRTGLFINDTFDLADGLSLSGGLRWDYYDMDPKNGAAADARRYEAISEQQLSPNLGLLWSVNDDVTAYVQYARGFKVPPYDLAYLDHDNSRFGYKIIPADDLDPERSNAFEIGMRGQVSDLSFTTAIYHNSYDDFINVGLVRMEDSDGDDIADVAVNRYANIDEVTIKGAEISLHYEVGNDIGLFMNASYQDGKDKTTGDYLSSISPLSGNIGIDYAADNWGGDLILRWAKAMTKINEGEVATAGHGVLDLSAYYQFSSNLKLNLSATNLLDKEYIDFNSISGTHKDNFSSDDRAFQLEPGREFSLSLKYEF